jgi:YNFM family putative membrane transporter
MTDRCLSGDEIRARPAGRVPAKAEPAADRIAHGTAAYRRMTLALFIAGFSTFGLLYDVQPLLPFFTSRFHVGAANSSLAVSMATGAMALSFFPAGILSDRLGRLPVMTISLFASALLTVLSSLLPGCSTLLVMRALTGIALAGVPSVAMAYVTEEVELPSIGAAMGLYVGGSAIGGMTGRLGMTLIAEHFGWRGAMGAMGLIGLGAALLFHLYAPASRAFAPLRHDIGAIMAAIGRLLRDPVLRLLYLEGFLLMGAFVSIYSYAGFRLQAPPYGFSQSAVSCIFLLYILGSLSSAWFGGLAGRVGREKLFWLPVGGVLVGIALTAASPFVVIVLGIAAVSAAFFAAHSTVSGGVGQRAGRDRAQAASLYLLFYYLGSSILGSAGGFAWTAGAWPGVTLFTGTLVATALAIALRFRAAPAR